MREPSGLSRLPRLAVALGMSLLFWLYVSSITDSTRPQTSTIHPNVPIEVRHIDQNLLIVNELPSVNLQIANNGRNEEERDQNPPVPYVDLGNLRPGNTIVQVQVDNVDDPNAVAIQPAQIPVWIEEVHRTSFPVTTRYIAANTKAFDPADLRLSPDRVIVQGARRNVSRVTEVRMNVDLASLSPDAPQTQALFATDRAGKTIIDVTIDPKEVLVSLPPPAASTPTP